MKLSDINGIPPQVEPQIFPRSSLAEPPISQDECRGVNLGTDTAVCRWHKGLIAASPTASDTEGKVYFCPVGKMYWRYTKQLNEFLKPLKYPGRLQ